MDARHRRRLELLAAALRAGSRRARSVELAVAGLLLLALLDRGRAYLAARAAEQERAAASLEEALAESRQGLAEAEAARSQRAGRLAQFRASLNSLTAARRALYESGLQLQEEKRQLEKQWEIMTTYLLVDEEGRKVHLMRGEQSLESFAVRFGPLVPFGGEAKAPPASAAIVSKERFAHPERPKSEQVGSQLRWEPPQVGSSLRANALGEYVIFTKGSLILHGPPRRAEEHAAFPHYCAGLSLAVARRLYESSFIGTKVAVKAASAGNILKR